MGMSHLQQDIFPHFSNVGMLGSFRYRKYRSCFKFRTLLYWLITCLRHELEWFVSTEFWGFIFDTRQNFGTHSITSTETKFSEPPWMRKLHANPRFHWLKPLVTTINLVVVTDLMISNCCRCNLVLSQNILQKSIVTECVCLCFTLA